MKKVAFYTLGCKVNQVETESMEKLFSKDYEIVSFNEKADIYIINTCIVTNQSARKSRQMVSRARRRNENALIAVVGCYSQTDPEEVAKLIGVDVIIGTEYRNRIVELVEQAEKDKKQISIVKEIREKDHFDDLPANTDRDLTRAYIKIQEGCNQFCSYCIIPYARGPIQSRPMNSILKETKALAESGYSEVILTGIHVTSYGKDLDSGSLIEVIEKVAEIPGIKRIRLSSLEPRIITKDFLQRMKQTKKACDHFHMSLQSGSDKILKLMNRKYTRDEYKEKVELIREFFPEAGITTDIIVGFPGETEEDFQDTLDYVKELNFLRVHVFRYSKRDGTVAATMENQVPGDISQERSRKLIDLSERLTDEILNEYIGEKLDVLFEEENIDGFLYGYSRNYIRTKIPYNEKLTSKLVEVIGIERDGEELIVERRI